MKRVERQRIRPHGAVLSVESWGCRKQAPGFTGALYRTLRTTNPIENFNGSMAHFARNVKRCKDGQMTLRWIAGALSDAKGRFRKLRGHRDMRLLLAAWKARSTQIMDAERKAA